MGTEARVTTIEGTEALMAIDSMLDFLLDLERKRRADWEAEMATLPEGYLCVLSRENGTFFQHAKAGKRLGITNDIDLVYKLARKRYLQLKTKEQKQQMLRIYEEAGPLRQYRRKMPKRTQKSEEPQGTKSAAKARFSARKTSRNLSKIKQSPLEKLLDKYGRAGLDILRITCTEQQYKWTKAQYRRNTKNPEQLIFETYSGIKVRSKSEQSIGNKLELKGIPYRYEMEFTAEVAWMGDVMGSFSGGRYKSYYPDFTILTSSGEYILWEHLGRVDLKAYREHNMEKIAAYRQGPGYACKETQLILTFENDLITLETLDRIIDYRIMPYL